MKGNGSINVFGILSIVLALVVATSIYATALADENCSLSEASGNYSLVKQIIKPFSIKISKAELSPFEKVPGTEELRFATDCTPVPVARINVSGTWGGRIFLLGSVKSAFIMDLMQASDDTLSGTITFYPGMERMLITGSVSGDTITLNQSNGEYWATMVASDTSVMQFEGSGRDSSGADFNLISFR